jgi:hypothetical protein
MQALVMTRFSSPHRDLVGQIVQAGLDNLSNVHFCAFAAIGGVPPFSRLAWFLP